jgi:glycosyltransferase involved in cell wall biosynthesis
VTGLRVLNPLPRALAHYQEALLAVLDEAGVPAGLVDGVDIEREQNGVSRHRLAASVLRERLRPDRVGDPLLVLWPALGFLESAGWWGRCRTFLVMHDPVPLRPQLGMGSRERALARCLLRSRQRLDLIVHSERAAIELAENGLDSILVPLPMSVPREARESEGVLLVAGQYKPSRDLDLMYALAPRLRAAGIRPRIVGRGWPEIDGWEVRSEFVPDRDFDREISVASMVLVPYTSVGFQSDVAVRAAERGVPVVGTAASNVHALFGPEWAGMVRDPSDVESWWRAVEEVRTVSRSEVHEALRKTHGSVVAAWRDVLEGVC